jgi:hypothetical protein
MISFSRDGDMQGSLTTLFTWLNRDNNKVDKNITSDRPVTCLDRYRCGGGAEAEV